VPTGKTLGSAVIALAECLAIAGSAPRGHTQKYAQMANEVSKRIAEDESQINALKSTVRIESSAG
jgi:hypothetical protein